MSDQNLFQQISHSLGFASRRIRNLSLQARLIAAISLITSLVALALGYFSFFRAQQIQSYLRDQLQTTVIKDAESQLTNTALVEANRADSLMASITQDLTTQASYLQNILSMENVLDYSPYWDSHKRLVRLADGQWDNSNSDPGSILVPSTVLLTGEELDEITSFISLDFITPQMLARQNNVTASYFIDSDGVTIYYPNIDLASVVGNFNATTEPFFLVASPENNPKHLPVWTVPYQDPALTGLIVTNSMPVYDKNNVFLGVFGMDLQLAKIANQVADIRAGNSGYGFLIDSNGHIIVLPEKGYAEFELTPALVPVGQPISQSILNTGSDSFKQITNRMVAGESGISTTLINGQPTYIAFAPLKSVQYSLGIVVPVSELNTAFLDANSQLEQQTKQTNNYGLAITAILLLFAGAISTVMGQLITAPLHALTQVAQKITAGDLSVKAEENTKDEVGMLAKAFNNMTAQLSDSISNLENRVTERTDALTKISEINQLKAGRLTAISEISRATASLKKLDELLPEITRRISDLFGYYHVGIFLLDANHEYAVLEAANSTGGQQMLNHKHRLKIGQAGIVGFVTSTGQSRIALDVGDDAIYLNNPDLPDTHSELALPLKIGDEIIGAVDMQSTETNAFSSDDLDILGLLADQISTAIQNSRLFEETRTALAESQNIYTQSALSSWREINRQSHITGYSYVNGVVAPIDQDAAQETSTLKMDILAIPILFRGQTLGVLNIRQPGRTRAWSETEVRLFQAIVERLSFALENARLYIDAQKRATKERIIGDIGAKISGSVSLENIMQTAVEELGRTIPGAEIAIQFENEPDEI